MTTRPVQQLIAIKPITIPAAERPFELQAKVTAPRTGQNLAVIVFSHGNAWSMNGYEPLVDRWAAAGFVVVQPTHLDWRGNGIGFDDPRFDTIWRVRIADLHAIIDDLSQILDMAGGLDSRIDREHVAVVGHSWGGQSAGALLGARVLDADDVPGDDLAHPAVRAGALVGVTGTGDTLTPFAETTDDDPSTVAFVADAVGAYLLDVFDLDHTSWTELRSAAARSDPPYTIDHK